MERNIFTCLSSYLQDATNPDDYSNASLMYEGIRLKTFHCINIATSTIRLAAAGFYATSNGDETKCYSCGVTHRGWRSMDNPFLIHRQISSNCRLVTGTAADSVSQSESRLVLFQCPNIPQPMTDHGTTDRHSNQDVNTPELASQRSQTAAAPVATHMSACAPAWSPTSQLMFKVDKDSSPRDTLLSLPSTGRYDGTNRLHFEGAVHPHYSELDERLKSFVTWPVGHCKKLEDLATAGFFYAGYADCVRCFVCGIGLKTWEEEDDPWTEHVRWRSSCDYVMAVKGKDFVIQTLAAIESEQQNATNNDVSTKNQPSPQDIAVDMMQTLECRKALEMGFHHEDVKQKAMTITSTQGRHSLKLDVLIERLVMDEDISRSGASSLQPQASAPGYKTYSPDSDHEEREDKLEPAGRHPILFALTTTDSPNKSKRCESGQTKMRMDHNSSGKGVENALNPCHESLPSETFSNADMTNERKGGSLTSYSQTTEEENREMKESSLCKVCLDDQANIVFLPCGHLVTCAMCSPALDRCPVCRKHIRGTVRVYLANKASVQTND